MTESIIHAIMPHYAFRIYEWQWQDGGHCRLKTDSGPKRLCLEADYDAVRVRSELLRQLAAEGFRLTPRPILTVHGDTAVLHRGTVCTVCDDLVVTTLTESPTDLTAAARNLNEAHRALRSVAFQSHLVASDRRPLTTLSTRLRQARQTLQEATLIHDGSPFARAYEPMARYTLERAARAESALLLAGLGEREADEHVAQWTLGGYDLGMLGWTRSGNIATLDWDRVALGDPEWDLFSFCRSLYERGAAQALPLVLDGYAHVGEQARERERRAHRLVGFVGFPFAIARAARQFLDSSERQSERHVRTLQACYRRDFPSGSPPRGATDSKLG